MKRLKRIVFGISLIFLICVINNVDVYADNLKAKNLTEFRQLVYKNMLVRKEKIVIDYSGKDYKSIFESFKNEKFLDEIGALDDVNTSDDFDYLVHNISYIKTGMKYGSSSKAQFTINITWRESLGELQYVNLRVADILEKCNISNIDSVYERIKVLHDYIVNNVEYDVTLKNENAYSAIKKGSSTCQGYSLLFYKLLAEAGIKSRYITGTGISSKDTGPHGWNIVKIGDTWYNVDVTWDDPVYLNGSSKNQDIKYDYFLKGSKNFDSSHKRDDKFLTDEFLTKHPVSESDFDKNNDVKMSDMTEEVVQETEEPEEEALEESNNFIDRIQMFISGLSKEKGHIPQYIIKSFKELDEQYKRILYLLVCLLLVTIVFKFYSKSKVDSEEDSYENFTNKQLDTMRKSDNFIKTDSISKSDNYNKIDSSRKNDNSREEKDSIRKVKFDKNNNEDEEFDDFVITKSDSTVENNKVED